MLQFYFLSVVMNLLAGYILFTGDVDAVPEFKNGFSLKDETVRLVTGILSAAVGLMKLLSVIEGDVPVIGDIIPVLTGFFSGFILIYEHYRNRSSVGISEKAEKIDRILAGNKKLAGAASIIAAALHFLFPKVLLL